MCIYPWMAKTMMHKSFSKQLFAWLLFSLSYLLLAILCLQARDPWSLSTSVWLPAGLTMIALCHTSRTTWPIWIVTSGLLHAFVSFLYGRPAEVTALFTVADIIIFTLASFCWQRLASTGFTMSLFQMSLACCSSVLILCLSGGFILYLFLLFLGYPVEIIHSLIWGISGATGALATAPFFIFDGGSISCYLSHIRRISFKKLCILVAAAMVGLSFLLPSHLFSEYFVSDYALLFFAWIMTVIVTLSCSTFFVALNAFYLSLTISLGTLYNLGPFMNTPYAGWGIFISQIYVLSLIVSSSLIFSQLKELNNKSDILESIFSLITQASPVSGCSSFRYYPGSDVVEWTSTDLCFDSRFISTSGLLLGRIDQDDRKPVSDFFRLVDQMEKIKEPVLFHTKIMDDNLTFHNASFVFHSPEFRGKNLRLAGLMIFH